MTCPEIVPKHVRTFTSIFFLYLLVTHQTEISYSTPYPHLPLTHNSKTIYLKPSLVMESILSFTNVSQYL